ncbi:hypothetical protein [Ruegeria sp. HKCCD6119]|uniref:hypothetical protein n=1 Tax=Ruegeria sp. HKCCD6119 TaxID=2683003 RepID=UPI0014920D4A|nr:hypothetical protein [Ruegeria sp. HKCCD6119]NOD84030.1 hypothetical protein [Ruegeria sp. HKCCD6119]
MADNPDPNNELQNPQGISLLWPFLVGSVFLLLILGIVAFGEDPSPTQFVIYRIIIALGGAGFAVALTGHLQIQFPIFRRGYIRAAAAFAVFVILFFFTPASLTVDDGEIEAKRLIDQYKFSNQEVVSARKLLGGSWELTTEGLEELAENAEEPTQEKLEAARNYIISSLQKEGAAQAFTTVVASHVEMLNCVEDGTCNKRVTCSGIFPEIEGFRNLFCEQIINAGERLNNNLWERYKDFSHNTCRVDFLNYYVLSKNVGNLEQLEEVCLPVQCWATNTEPPYPCQLRQQLLGGQVSPT